MRLKLFLKKAVKAVLPYGFFKLFRYFKSTKHFSKIWGKNLINNINIVPVNWDVKQQTGYNEIDFYDVEFYDENILLGIEIDLQGKIEGTKYSKIEMSYKERAFLNGIIRKTKPQSIVKIR